MKRTDRPVASALAFYATLLGVWGALTALALVGYLGVN